MPALPKARLTTTAPPRFGYDLERISIHPTTVGAIETKLAVNAPRDQYEQEADRVAEQVMRMPSDDVPGVHRYKRDRLGVNHAGFWDSVRTAVPPTVHEVLRTPGQSLDPAARALMEPRFGQDFSRVRVHVDSQAGASARDMGALAYTVGRDIVFAQGQFALHTASGQRLLAHELAHTVQQGAGAGRLQRQPSPDSGVPETLPRKVEDGEKAPAPAESVCKSPSDIPLPCSPKGLPDVDFAKVGAPKDAFGLTQTLSEGFAGPDVVTKPAGKDKVVIQTTEAKPVPCKSFFTKAGTVWRTISLDAAKPEERANAEKCRGSSYLREFSITPDGEKKISEAEMEHCADFKHAFDISVGCFAAVVNDFARKKTGFPSQDAAVDAVTKRAGRKPDTWMARYLELLEKTRERDKRKWHTAAEPQGPGLELETDRSNRCKSRFPTEINEKSFPQVGKDKHPTSEVIK